MSSHIESLGLRDLTELLEAEFFVQWRKRPVSGTYRNGTPAGSGSILELRVDVDGRRPQDRLSGDLYTHFTFCGIPITFFTGSFVVQEVAEERDSSSITLSGPVIYYSDAGNTADTITVRIPRVNYYASPAAACVDWFTNGTLVRSYVCPKTSSCFRTATLEIDRFQGTAFPPEIDPDIDPSPSGLPETVSIGSVFERSGICLDVTYDDTLNDSDSADPGNNWSNAELHDLMENRFDSFANTLQWELYGVVVPRFGNPNYNSGGYGIMFDWGGWQPAATFLRQGWAIAEDALKGRAGGLYNTSDEKDRLILETAIHEIGHAFNLPHTWLRALNMDSGSESFMNYPWGYTANGGTETDFWENFRWEFDDVELIWMRHADRNDVIFGGRDWIWNNLSSDFAPATTQPQPGPRLSVASSEVFDLGVPVHVEIELKNTTDGPLHVVDRLAPEDGLTRVIIHRPNGEIVDFVPPVRRLEAPPELRTLAPGETIGTSIGLTFGAKGYQFAEPGEYLIQVYFPCYPFGFVATATHRIRISHPRSRASEELMHLLTSREASQYLYYGGTRRTPQITERLIEATERCADTDPVAVRHISAALARDADRVFKQVAVKNGERVVKAAPADTELAVARFEAAMTPLPDPYQTPAFDAFMEVRLVEALTDGLRQLERNKDAQAVLERSLTAMERRQAAPAAISQLQRKLRAAKRRKQ